MTLMLRVEAAETAMLVTTDDLFVGVEQPNGDMLYQPAYALAPDGELCRLPGVPASAYESGRFVVRAGEGWMEVRWDAAP